MPKRSLIAALVVAAPLVACDDGTSEGDAATGLANPASQFCVDEGGRSEIRSAEDGSQSGVCILGDGREVDEWDYYREHHPEDESG
jgi:hypothetical protein